MTLQMLYRNATLFLFYLREVDKASNRVENELHISMKNKELIQMLGLEKSLVYFSTSLKGNELVLEKLMRTQFVKAYPEDEELLEDVIIENKQAIEMAQLNFKTDNFMLFDWSIKNFQQTGWLLEHITYDLPIEQSQVMTEYERRYRNHNIPICSLTARKG